MIAQCQDGTPATGFAETEGIELVEIYRWLVSNEMEKKFRRRSRPNGEEYIEKRNRDACIDWCFEINLAMIFSHFLEKTRKARRDLISRYYLTLTTLFAAQSIVPNVPVYTLM